MKRILSLMFVVAIASANVLAQDQPKPPKEKAPPKTPEERADNMTKRLTKELALTPEQQTKAKATILKHEQERDDRMKASREEHEKIEADFKAFLTDDQFKKFHDKNEEMKKKREERKGQQPPTPPANGDTPPPPPAPQGK
jgi:Spy/CpxP family protein refolding chaperone